MSAAPRQPSVMTYPDRDRIIAALLLRVGGSVSITAAELTRRGRAVTLTRRPDGSYFLALERP